MKINTTSIDKQQLYVNMIQKKVNINKINLRLIKFIVTQFSQQIKLKTH